MKLKILLLIIGFVFPFYAQNVLTGVVKGKDEKGNYTPLVGSNITWQNTNKGTTADIDGKFTIPIISESNTLVISNIGYKTEKIIITTNQQNIEVLLEPEPKELSDVEVVGKQTSSYQDYKGIENTTIMTNKELQKAACCTLAESFETNPSIDVSFTDAITGIRQIEMLGLAGIYSQTTMEAVPYIRGLMSNVGLFFVPGTWIKSINVSKGIGSVSNGFESITGQIDIEMQKPFDDYAEKNGLINLYGDNEQRFEGNLNYRYKVNEHLSSMTLLHASSRQHKKDMNSDSFMDMPTFKTFNIMQRWQYRSLSNWESQLGFQVVNDEKNGGTINNYYYAKPFYNYRSSNKLFNIYGKTGFIFDDNNKQSFGVQWSFSKYNNKSNFGNKIYDGDQKNLYLNFIYQTNLANDFHFFRTGLSFVYDEFNESFFTMNYDRKERIPGLFLEYTYKPDAELSIVSGLRFDNHNKFGLLFTPRMHIRYSPNSDWVFRLAAGRGYRTSNIFVEYSSSFTSSRSINIIRSNDFGYGLEMESAWNYGLNLTYYFLYEYRDATLSIDIYRTNFDNSTIADLDSDSHKITFSSVKNGAYSTSIQTELNIEPMLNFTVRLAYRFIDARQLINGIWKDKPFSARHRSLINMSYSTERETLDDYQMNYDLTIQWFGSKRIPSTESNPVGLRARSYSPNFFLINAQVTRSFNELFDFYIGVENLFDFRQNDPIIDSNNPNSQYFDASLIWGPVSGRMVYAGLRYKI